MTLMIQRLCSCSSETEACILTSALNAGGLLVREDTNQGGGRRAFSGASVPLVPGNRIRRLRMGQDDTDGWNTDDTDSIDFTDCIGSLGCAMNEKRGTEVKPANNLSLTH